MKGEPIKQKILLIIIIRMVNKKVKKVKFCGPKVNLHCSSTILDVSGEVLETTKRRVILIAMLIKEKRFNL
jgi:hypothetical protein